ncbi:4693_t:CDS:2 [Acaulospora morrowiae]|uniref:4693_t:CDS:1 n=1 Tax=Acaulospora morrowiae TaxID=94023 RepID=A0A9N8W8Y8_9GLOM|nr:4693_t:CDS:2 [Acaulospora morrowiae]
MVAIAILGSDPITFFLITHLTHHSRSPQHQPENINKILFVGQPNDDDYGFGKVKHVKVKTFDDYEIAVPREQINYTTDLKELVEFNPDYIFVTLKGNQVIEILQEIAELDGKTVVVTFNGYHNSELVHVALPNTKIIDGMIVQYVYHLSDCQFVQETEGCIYLQSIPDALPIQQIFQQSQLTVRTCSNIKSFMYGRLIMNLAGAIVALSGLSFTQFIKNKNWRKILASSMWEAFEVFKHHNIVPLVSMDRIPSFLHTSLPLHLLPYLLLSPNWVLNPVVMSLLKNDPISLSSMSKDFKCGRRTGIEELQGEIVKLATVNGSIKTAYNSGVYGLVKLVEKSMMDKKDGWKVAFTNEEVIGYIEHGTVPACLL